MNHIKIAQEDSTLEEEPSVFRLPVNLFACLSELIEKVKIIGRINSIVMLTYLYLDSQKTLAFKFHNWFLKLLVFIMN